VLIVYLEKVQEVRTLEFFFVCNVITTIKNLYNRMQCRKFKVTGCIDLHVFVVLLYLKNKSFCDRFRFVSCQHDLEYVFNLYHYFGPNVSISYISIPLYTKLIN